MQRAGYTGIWSPPEADAARRTVVIGDPTVTSSAAGAARLAAVSAGAALPTGAAPEVRFVPDSAASGAWKRRSDDYERLLLPLRRIYRTWPGPDVSEGRT